MDKESKAGMGKKIAKLFEPLVIKGVTFKNRIAMAPVGTSFCHTGTGEVTDQLLCYYYNGFKI